MAVLIKVKAGTLIETIVASVLLVLVFAIGSLVVSNVLKSTINQDRTSIIYELEKLEYRYLHDDLEVPYAERFQSFEIQVSELEGAVVFEAYELIEHRLLVEMSLKKKNR